MRCEDKVAYSKKAAQTKLNKLISSGRWSHKSVGRIYHCGFCNEWHITSHEKKNGNSWEWLPKLTYREKWNDLLNK